MTDEQLRDALRSLPRHRASGGFTDRVLANLDHSKRTADGGSLWRRLQGADGPGASRRRWAAVAVAVILAVLVPIAVRQSKAPPAADSRQALQELRTELEELKRLAAEPEADDPVLYLGGDDRVELVVDLRDPMGESLGAPLGDGPSGLRRSVDDRGGAVTPALHRDQNR